MAEPESARGAEVVLLHPVQRARLVAESLLRLEQPSAETIEGCLGDVDRHVLRHVLVDELLGGFLAGNLAERLEGLFRHLGLARQRDRLVAIAADRERSVRVRSTALQILSAAGGGIESVLGDGRPWMQGAIVDLGLRAALVDLMSHAGEPGDAIGALVSLPPPMRKKAFADMEELRRAAGIPAALVYGHMLAARVWGEQREAMLAGIVDEGGLAALDLLVRLRDAEPDARARRDLSRAVLELRTRRLDPVPAPVPPNGQARLSVPDHHGLASLQVRFENPDGSVTWILGEISPARGLVEANVIACESPAEAAQRAGLLQIVGIYGATDLRLGQAARLARDAAAMASAEAPRRDAEVDAALFLLDRIPAEDLPPIEPATSFPEEAIHDLIAHVRYVALGLPEVSKALPDGKRPEFLMERWLRKTAGSVARPEVVERISGVMRFMSVWHALAGEPENAALAAGLAQATERDFQRSPLVHQLIREELDRRWPARPLQPSDFVEDAATRHRLVERFFADLAHPRFADMARLDFAEVAYWALELAFESAAPDRKIDDGSRERLALTLARTYLEFGGGTLRRLPREKHVGAVVAEMARAVVSEAGLDPERAHAVAELVESDVATFHAQVCSTCPFFCEVNGDEDAEGLLDGEGHPAEVEVEEEDE